MIRREIYSVLVLAELTKASPLNSWWMWWLRQVPKGQPGWLNKEDDKVFSWAKSKRPACWGRKEVIGRAKYHGQPILNGKDWKVVSWPSPRSAVWNEFIDWQLAKYRCQSLEILKQIEELLAAPSPSASPDELSEEVNGIWIEMRSLSAVPSLGSQPDEIKWRECYCTVKGDEQHD